MKTGNRTFTVKFHEGIDKEVRAHFYDINGELEFVLTEEECNHRTLAAFFKEGMEGDEEAVEKPAKAASKTYTVQMEDRTAEVVRADGYDIDRETLFFRVNEPSRRIASFAPGRWVSVIEEREAS